MKPIQIVALWAVCSTVAPALAQPLVDFGKLVLDTGPTGGFVDLFPDKLDTKLVFGEKGIGGFGGSPGGDTGENFFGLSFDIGTHSVGGVECSWGACFGARASIWGNGEIGAKYRFASSPGTLDLRYPLGLTLDLPYSPSGGLPTAGQKFTIGSSWTPGAFKVLSEPGKLTSTTPLLASHGPSVQGYVNVGVGAWAGASGKLCFIDCIGDGISLGGSAYREVVSLNRDGSGKLRVLGSEVSGAGGDSIVSFDVRIPKLDAVDTSVVAGKLQTQASDKAAGIKWDIDKTVSALIGFPLTGKIVDLTIGGKGLYASYVVFDASAQLNAGLTQKVTFSAKPVVTLEFSAPVQRLLGNAGGIDQWGAPTQQISFDAGGAVTLRAPGASSVGVATSYSLSGSVTNTLWLDLYARLDGQALKLESTIKDLGPLFGPAFEEIPLGQELLRSKSFDLDIEGGYGQWFNLFFKPGEDSASATQHLALGFFDPARWDGTPCATQEECVALSQPKIAGVFDISSIGGLPPCYYGDGCDADAMQSFLQALRGVIARGSVNGTGLSTALRLFDERGGEVFVDGLALLDDPLLDSGRGYTQEDMLADIAALASLYPLLDLRTPPVPEPGAWGMLMLGLVVLAASRRFTLF